MSILPSTLIAAFTAVVAISDLYARRVPNTWLLCALALGGCWHLFTWAQGQSGPPWPALLGLVVGLAVLLPFHVFGWMGAGDVKFFAVLGFLLGARALLPIWIIGSVLAGAHAVAILLSRHWLRQAVPGWTVAQDWAGASPLGQRIQRARDGRQGLPYAAWLGVGALATAFHPALMHW